MTARATSPQEPTLFGEDEASAPLGEGLGEGQLYDFITNQPVADTAAERTLQAVARSLVDEYGFDHTQLGREQLLVYEQLDDEGRARKVRQRLSVVVYPEGLRKGDVSKVIRVCLIQPPGTKGNDGKHGVQMLEDVMGALPACDYGLWTNGTDLVFKEKITGGGRLQPEYEDLYDLPGNGETAADLDRPDRQVGRIATGDNLQRTFARVHDYIYGNQGLKKDAAFWQVLNLIFCKIHDERTPGRRRFWVKGTERNTPEGQEAIADRIRGLFAEVKSDSNYASVFSDRDAIELNDRVLAYAVGELSRYNLLETDVDVKGAAYEEITSSMLKQQRGQFFTPTNVIRLMVEMMDPGGEADLRDCNNWPRCIDPACGAPRGALWIMPEPTRSERRVA
jgi:type I restriction enzyme M protein